MKKFLISWILPTVYQALLSALQGLAAKSTNSVDDKVVALMIENKEQILAEIKNSL